MRRGVKIAAAGVAVVGLLALASYRTTSVIWDGGFPSGEFRINVRDAGGKPVRRAVLRVYHGGTRDLASGYPLDNHTTGQELVSDEGGRITAVRRHSGLQFGGHAWRLFWVIPMGAKAPEYDCEITAEGFEPLKFPFWSLYVNSLPHKDRPKTKLEVDGKEVEVKMYEHTFTLGRY